VYRVMLYPLALGIGKPFFRDGGLQRRRRQNYTGAKGRQFEALAMSGVAILVAANSSSKDKAARGEPK